MEIPITMKAMVLEQQGKPLVLRDVPTPKPSHGQVLIQVHACGVCRTDLHIVDAELPNPKLPLIPGHEITGRVVEVGEGVNAFSIGDRVGVPWLGYTCSNCRYCKLDKENLCNNAQFTGYTIDGGYAEYTVADTGYCFHIPDSYSYAEAAPLLCAGLIGYRSYSKIGQDVERLGIYGFGAAAHIIAQIAIYQGKQVYAFVRPGDEDAKEFALKLGAVWAGNSTEVPPKKLDATIIFAPVGSLLPAALMATDKGGSVICGGIHMSDIPSFPYHLLWGERVVRSVANLTRKDGEQLLDIAPRVPVKTEILIFQLDHANTALNLLRKGEIKGAAVLQIRP